MAVTYDTSRTTLSGSFFSPDHQSQSSPGHLLINSEIPFLTSTDAHLAELMETLRVQINAVLRVSIPAQKRSRLVKNYWELEYLVKEIRLILGNC